MTKEQRANKAAEAAYPNEKEILKSLSNVEKWEFLGEQADRRDGFRLGYLTAENETIERAIKWFSEHLDFAQAQGLLIDDFRRAMEADDNE